MTDQRIRSRTQWRTMHLVLSVPVLGHLSETALCHRVEAALNGEDLKIFQVKTGRFRAKSFARVQAAAKRRDQQDKGRVVMVHISQEDIDRAIVKENKP